MTTATILSIVFNFVAHGDHTYKAVWTLDIGGHSELWVKDGDDHDTFAVVVIMTEYIVGHVLKAITYHHLLLKISMCGTIWGCATIKINHENKVISSASHTIHGIYTDPYYFFFAVISQSYMTHIWKLFLNDF